MSRTAKVNVEPDLIETEDERYTDPGLVGEWDRRNHTMYPTAGYHLDGRFLVYDDAFGSARDFRKLNLGLSGYQALGDSTRVLAGRVLNEGGFGDVPFSAQSILSGNRNLRGYSNGRYRGNQLLVVEAEYRWKFDRRWGAVVFAGLGWVADEVATMSLGETLPASGLGIRFTIIETYRINARIDYGWGKHDQAVYFSIGEHF
jgi:outer membrane translocation and assembly module TamA